MSEEGKGLKDSIETLNYLITQLIVELKQLNDNLQNLGFLQANKRTIQEFQEEKREKQGFKGDKSALMRYLKEKCPTVWANLDEVREFKSGDFLITFDYVDSSTYEKMSKEIKENLDGYYSKKYKGFIIPRAKEQGGLENE